MRKRPQEDRTLFDHAESIRAFGEQQFHEDILQPDGSQNDLVLAFFVIRAHTTYSAAVHLCSGGFAVDATMQLRNLVETLITLRFILATDGMAGRFADYDAVVTKRMLDRLENLPEDFAAAHRSDWESNREEIMRRYAEVKNKYADFNPRNWAGDAKSVERLALATGSCDLYNLCYGQFSQFVHGTVGTSHLYMEVGADDTAEFFEIGTGVKTAELLRNATSIYPLFWNEVSKFKGRPVWDDLRAVVVSALFEALSQRHDAEAIG